MADFKGFKGAAKRLDDTDLPRLGAEIGVGEDELHAFIEAETRGSGFDDQGRPRILFERHKFYKYCPAAKRDAAVKAGLANSRAGGYGKESEQYGKLQRAMAIDEQAALLSCSWGLAQVMGFNHKLAGYSTVAAMIRAFMADEENHLQAAVNFIKASGLDDELRRHDWKGFAKGYNGSGYAANEYDKKLATAFAKWQKIKDTPYAPSSAEKPVAASEATRIFTDTTTVAVVQSKLYELGYTEVGSRRADGAFDGNAGGMTRAAILIFRADNGLPATDAIDQPLLDGLDTAPKRKLARNDAAPEVVRQTVPEVRSNWLMKIGAFVVGIPAALGGFFDGILGNLGLAKGYIDPLKESFADIPGWVWLAVVTSVAGGTYLIARHGERKGVEAFQEGARR